MSESAGQRVVSRSLRTTGPDPSALPIVPIDGTYRFAPGQTSLTVPVRLNPNFVPTGKILLQVIAYLPRSHAFAWLGASSLEIEPSADQVPPEVVATGLSPRGISLTFSQPMDPASVEALGTYEVTGRPDGGIDLSEHPVTLETAVYDPATRTVTLSPTSPLTTENYAYFLRLPDSPASLPTDLLGNPLTDRMISVGT